MSKVPDLTLIFGIIKILATTLGETANGEFVSEDEALKAGYRRPR